MKEQISTSHEKLWNPNFIAAFIGNFLLFFAFYLLLPTLPIYLSSEFHAGKSTIGIVLSIYSLAILLIRPFSGFLVDYFRRKPLLLISYAVFTAFFCGYMLAGTLLLFTLLRALQGISFGVVTVSNSTLAIDVMPASQRGKGIGYYGVSSNLAMSIGPVFALTLYDYLPNFDYIFLSSLIAGIIGFILVCTIRPPHQKRTTGEPLTLNRFILAKGWPEAINMILISFGYGMIVTYAAIYGTSEIGITSGTGVFFILFAAGLIFSRFFSGKAMNSGRFNSLNTTGIILLLIGFVLFIFIKQTWSFYLSATILGFAYGFVCPAFQAMFINMTGSDKRGAANSTYFTAWDLGLGGGVLAGGYIAEAKDYSMAYIAALALTILAFLLFSMFTASHFKKNRVR